MNCQRNKNLYPVRRPVQVKGVHFSENQKMEKNRVDPTTTTIVFFDLYWLVVDADLIISG